MHSTLTYAMLCLEIESTLDSVYRHIVLKKTYICCITLCNYVIYNIFGGVCREYIRTVDRKLCMLHSNSDMYIPHIRWDWGEKIIFDI